MDKTTKWVCTCGVKNKASRSKCRSCAKSHKRVKDDVKNTIKKQLEGGSFARVKLSECAPNTWNPNHMAPDKKDKLWNGIIAVLREVVKPNKANNNENKAYLPPIIVRKHPKPRPKDVKYQIIDGEQRWTILCEHQDDPIIQEFYNGVVDAIILDLPDVQARIMTSTMNWLRGEPDPDKYAVFLKELMYDNSVSFDTLAAQLPESDDELHALIDTYEIPTLDVDVDNSDADFNEFMSKTGESENQDRMVRLSFDVFIGQGSVIQAELQRLAALFPGKNSMGNALERMAILSAQTPASALEATAATQQTESEESDLDVDDIQDILSDKAGKTKKDKRKKKVKRV